MLVLGSSAKSFVSAAGYGILEPCSPKIDENSFVTQLVPGNRMNIAFNVTMGPNEYFCKRACTDADTDFK